MSLLIDDPNTGDTGRPFGTYAEKVKARAREILRASGNPWTEFDVSRMYENHMQSLPTYREISARISARAQAASENNRLTPDEIQYLIERLAGANDPIGQTAAQKLQRMLQQERNIK